MTHIINTKIIESLGDLDLLLRVKEGIGELFTLPECALNDLEIGYIAQVVPDWLVGVCAVGMRI